MAVKLLRALGAVLLVAVGVRFAEWILEPALPAVGVLLILVAMVLVVIGSGPKT